MIQRASSSLALDVHFHSLVSDGVFVEEKGSGKVMFHQLPSPSTSEVEAVAWDTCRRVHDILIRRGLWCDDENQLEDTPSGMPHPGLARIYTSSIRGVLSMGPKRGQRVQPGARRTLERLARYVLRPPLANTSLDRLPNGHVVLRMKRTWRDGTAGMVFGPLDFLARLAALIPYPRVNTVRFAGVFASRARLREQVVPPSRGRDPLPCHGERRAPTCDGESLTWSQRLARAFGIDVFSCRRCGGRLTRIAIITATSRR